MRNYLIEFLIFMIEEALARAYTILAGETRPTLDFDVFASLANRHPDLGTKPKRTFYFGHPDPLFHTRLRRCAGPVRPELAAAVRVSRSTAASRRQTFGERWTWPSSACARFRRNGHHVHMTATHAATDAELFQQRVKLGLIYGGNTDEE